MQMPPLAQLCEMFAGYEKFVMDKAATGENATFLSYSEEAAPRARRLAAAIAGVQVMMQTFSAIQLQSAGLTTWKAIIKMPPGKPVT